MHKSKPPAFLKAARKACRRCSKPSMAPQRNLLRLLRRSSSVRRINGAVFFQSLCHYPGWFMNITNKDKSSQIIYKWAMFINLSISMDWWKRENLHRKPSIFPVNMGLSGLVYLVGGIPTPLKNMSSSVGMIIPNIWKNRKCSKPPISYEHNDCCNWIWYKLYQSNRL